MSNSHLAPEQADRITIGSTTSAALDAIRALGPSAAKSAFELWNEDLPDGVKLALQSRFCIALIASTDVPLALSDEVHIRRHLGPGATDRITISLGQSSIAVDVDSLEKNLLLVAHLPILFIHDNSWTASRFKWTGEDIQKVLRMMLGKSTVETESQSSLAQLDVRVGAQVKLPT
ncbi:hypothetical protein [Paraburkholderia ribeironis]|nr:hypothetical protein [Paraburkholderia ribeironis]